MPDEINELCYFNVNIVLQKHARLNVRYPYWLITLHCVGNLTTHILPDLSLLNHLCTKQSESFELMSQIISSRSEAKKQASFFAGTLIVFK